MSDQAVCARCGSARIVPRVRARDMGGYNMPRDPAVMPHENPDAPIFKETFLGTPAARVRGPRGDAELYAGQPGEFYAAHERSRRPRD